MPTDALTSAERAREFRYRRKHNLTLARAEVPMDLVEGLIDCGLLAEERASDSKALGDALIEAAKRLIRSGLAI